MKKTDVTVVLARHGKKDGFNSNRISNPEEVEAEAKKRKLEGFQEIEIHSTPIERAVDTALCVQKGFQKQNQVNEVQIYEMASGILSSAGTSVKAIMAQTEESKDLNLISGEIREQYKLAVESHTDSSWSKEDAGVGAWIKILKEEAEFLKTNGTEEFKNQQLQKKGISLLETILRICAYLINIEGKNKFIYSVNHAGFIEPLLVFLLEDQIDKNPVKKGLNVFQKMGGAFEPSEEVEIVLKNEKITFHLRGKVYEISRKKLEKEVEKLEKISIANQVIKMRK